jgi:DNA-binding NarL/FixJ family response regulator
MADLSESQNGSGIRVLICDDLDAMRRLLGYVIGLHAGLCVVGEARDGNEAIAEAARLQPDVILLDLSMPRRTGFDVLPEIKQVAPAARIIVLSGFSASTVEADVLALGAERYVEKGASSDTIAAAIQEVGAKIGHAPPGCMRLAGEGRCRLRRG